MRETSHVTRGAVVPNPIKCRRVRAIAVAAGLFVIGAMTSASPAATKIDFTLEDDGITPLLNGQMINQHEEFGILFEVIASGPSTPAVLQAVKSRPWIPPTNRLPKRSAR